MAVPYLINVLRTLIPDISTLIIYIYIYMFIYIYIYSYIPVFLLLLLPHEVKCYPSMNMQYSARLNRVSHLYEPFDTESDARYIKCLTGPWR